MKRFWFLHSPACPHCKVPLWSRQKYVDDREGYETIVANDREHAYYLLKGYDEV